MKKWLLVIRSPFLILSVVLALLGTSIAWYDGFFHLGHALLAFLGLLLAHISTNVFNEYFDYRSGIDLETQRTPFSGGSGALPAGLLSAKQALWLGITCLLLATGIGIYFVIVSGWLLLPLLLVAVICIVFYTPVILRIKWPEWAAGLGMGSLPVMGAYFVQTGAYNWPLVIAAVPSGILVYNLLLLNEFPDVEADKNAGRQTTPIVSGRRKAAAIYSTMTLAVYLWLIIAAATEVIPAFSLLGLLTLPLAIKAIKGSFQYEDMGKLVPAMASNVMVVLLTQLLVGIGYIISGAIS